MNSKFVEGLLAFAATLALAIPAYAAEVFTYAPPASGPDQPALQMYYLGSVGHVGEFPGKLVQMSCDARPAPQASDCVAGYRAALETPDGSVHPLIPGNDRTAQKMESARVQGENVRVFGRVYNNTGSILAGDIRLERGS